MENLEAKTFDQRGWITFKRNRLGKCVFNDLPVYAVMEKVSLIQRVCTKKHCHSLPSFSSTVRLECIQITDITCVCGGRGREEFLSSRCYCVLLCFVSVQFVSRIREVTQKVISTIGEHGKTQTLVS